MAFIVNHQPRVLPRQKVYRIIKRISDVALCVIALPLAVPLMALSAIAIAIEDPNGPILFTQMRIGKGGRPFKIFKFRTIRIDSDLTKARAYMKAYVRGEAASENEAQQDYKPITNQQIFFTGRVLRKTSLDELPQIINVLIGDMSIVGPRPNVTWEVDSYYPWHYERLEVLPGITGLAQVRGRSTINFNSLVRYDVKYIEQQSFLLDVKILFWTLLALVRAKGAR